MKLGNEQKIYYTLRIASAMCFIGHGAFGIITKAIWCNYFAMFGIGHDMAYTLMPCVGVIDICFGLLILIYPLRIAFGWLVAWGLITALLRPLSGEPFAEFIERAGNYGAPLAFLLLTYTKENNWFKPTFAKQIQPNEQTVKRLKICLRIVVFLLLAGHGWLNLIEKKSLVDQYTALGFSNSLNVAHVIGSIEILAAFSVLIKLIPLLLILFFIWKMLSELFYPHWEVFEFIERGGSYGCILALYFLSASNSYSLSNKKENSLSVAS